jgi:predicted nucleic acid-binding protein
VRLYLDANVIIYSIVGASPFRDSVLARLLTIEAMPNGLILTSRLSRLECRTKPIRDGNAGLLASYETFFTRSSLRLLEIDAAVMERATDLRVRYGFKTPDAIHVATALVCGADVLLTGDRHLARCGEIRIDVIGE